MHYKKVKGILSAKNGMNLYRGCSHGCIYCDSRSDCYQMDHAFEDIEVKENALELLEYSLQHKRKKCMIGTGSMSDPYMPLEQTLQYTRSSLELAYRYGFGFSLITKSDLVLRDLDILKAINEQTKCVVQMTLTTANDELCLKLEPNVCPTSKRIEALMKLHEAGIPTVVWLSPILPFINDTMDNIKAILDACIKAKVYGIICFDIGLTLREGNREYFYEQLDHLFPGMKERYQKAFGNNYVCTSPNNKALMKLFRETCRKHHIVYDFHEVFTYLNKFETKHELEQLRLF